MTVAAQVRMRQVRRCPEPENSLPPQRGFGEFPVRGTPEMHDSYVVLVLKFCRRMGREGVANFRLSPSYDRRLLKFPETMT